jgi:hypothetical protein
MLRRLYSQVAEAENDTSKIKMVKVRPRQLPLEVLQGEPEKIFVLTSSQTCIQCFLLMFFLSVWLPIFF